MKCLVGVLIFLLTIAVEASIPTVEGLFRNSDNKEPTGDMIVFKVKVSKESLDELLNTKPIVEDKNLLKESMATQKRERFFKYILSKENEKRVQLLQVEYTSVNMDKTEIKAVKYIPNLRRSLEQDTFVDRKLIYSILDMVILNSSDTFKDFLKAYSANFLSNEEMLNEEKKLLLGQYKNYLMAIKNDKSIIEVLESPLRPEDPEKLKEIKALLSSRMYKKPETVKLTKINNEFYWKVDLSNFIAYFTHNERYLKMIDLSLPNGNIKVQFGDFVLFDGIHELPRMAIYKDVADNTFRISFLSLLHFNNRTKPIQKRYREYLDWKKEYSTEKVPLTTGEEDGPIADFFTF